MPEKLKLNDVYHLSKDVLILKEKDGAEFTIATGTPIQFRGKQKRGSVGFSLFSVQNGFFNFYLPDSTVSEYIHDAIVEATRRAR